MLLDEELVREEDDELTGMLEELRLELTTTLLEELLLDEVAVEELPPDTMP